MPAGDLGFQQVPVLIILLQTFFIQSPRFHTVRPHFSPKPRFILSLGENAVRRYHIDADPVLRQLQTRDTTQLVTRRFGCTVGAKSRAWAGDVLRGYDNDIASRALQDKVVRDFTERQQSTLHVDSLEFLKGIEVNIFQEPDQRNTRVHDHNIDPAPGENDLFKALDDGLFVSHINRDSHHAFAGYLFQVRRETIKFLVRQIGGNQMATFLQQSAANAIADRPRGARDQGYFIRQGQIRFLFCLTNVENSKVTKTYNLGL